MSDQETTPAPGENSPAIPWERVARAMLEAAIETQDSDGYTVAAEVRAVWRVYVRSEA